jgi:S-adenosylmethionine:tRNA ribosyltransferase-isomerase
MNKLHSLNYYDYFLTKELIAQQPSDKRDQSKLLVLDRSSGSISHSRFYEVTKFLSPGDCLVLNETKVIPARLFGKRETGGRVEALFLSFEGESVLALLRPFIKPGGKIIFPGHLAAEVAGKTDLGEMVLKLSGPALTDVLNRHGQMPLPPYIKRPKSNDFSLKEKDKEKYQTVYSQKHGSIAAPTAGLHFTDELIERIEQAGIEIARVVLHVGWGTFKPVITEDITKHVMLPEYYYISKEAAGIIEKALKRKKRVITIGTTSTRALESAVSDMPEGVSASEFSSFFPKSGKADIFIFPGYQFRLINSIITNFHLPKSTPLLMASAFAGRDLLLDAYRQAIGKKYRFFSYGDAMMIL